MPHPEHQLLPDSFLSKMISSTAGAFAIFAMFLFFQILFKYDFVCPCDPDFGWHVHFCILYMVLPALIFFFISILVDQQHLKICGFTREDLPCSSIESFMKCCAVSVKDCCMGLLWVIIALIDGDWYVCLMTHSNGTAEEQLACKQLKDRTKTEEVDVRRLA